MKNPKSSITLIFYSVLFIFLFSEGLLSQTSNIFPIKDVNACDYYILPSISGEGLDGSEGYYSKISGQGDMYLPGDTIFESKLLHAFIGDIDNFDEECFMIQIYQSLDLGTDTMIVACDSYTLPPIGAGIDIQSGYYTQPNGQGKFYSPGNLIARNMTLYATTGTGDCLSEKKIQIIIGESTIFDLTAEVYCPYFVVNEGLRTHSFSANDPDSLWIVDSLGNVFDEMDTMFSSGMYTVFSDVKACVTQEKMNIQIQQSIPEETIEDKVVCGDQVSLPESDIPYVHRSYYKEEVSGLPIRNPYRHESVPAFGDFTFIGVNSIDKCREEIDFQISFLQEARSTDSLYQKVCSGQVYSLNFLKSHESINFKVDEIIPAETNPFVSNNEFDMRSIDPGMYNFLLISYSDPICGIEKDTTIFSLEVTDDCQLADTTLIRCQGYVVEKYFPPILGGILVNGDFVEISDNCCFFEYIDEEDLEDTGYDYVYYISENQHGVKDTARIKMEDETDTEIQLSLSSQSLCFNECLEIVADVPIKDAQFMHIKGIRTNFFDRLLHPQRNEREHLLTICFDPGRTYDESNAYLSKDTLYVPSPDTTYKFEVLIAGAPCKSGFDSLSFATRSIPINHISPTLCVNESVEIAGEIFDFKHPKDQIILPGAAKDGCDSIINVEVAFDEEAILRLNNSYSLEDTVYVNCNAYYFGNEKDTIRIQRGPSQCDSLIIVDFYFENRTLDVNILVQQLSCDGDIVLSAFPDTVTYYQWYRDLKPISGANGSEFVISGNSLQKEAVYSVFIALDSLEGISELVQLEFPDLIFTDTVKICQGDEYLMGDSLINEEGDYVQTFARDGCDSIVYLNLTFFDPAVTIIALNICPGDTINWRGQSISEFGTYRDTLQSQSGCDRLLELHVDMQLIPEKEVFASICQGDEYLFLNDTLRMNGIYEYVIPSFEAECDTMLTLYLETLAPPLGDTMYIELDEGQIFEHLGHSYSEEGLFPFKPTNTGFCDPIHYLQIVFITSRLSTAFYIPNVFSPNGDHVNDNFQFILPDHSLYSIEDAMIFNRWGNRVWKYQRGANEFWDGRVNGQEAVPDVYAVMIRLMKPDGTYEVIYRDLSLVR